MGTTPHAAGTPERLLPWLLLLPGAVLAWPFAGAPLADDPFPHLAATGLVALAVLPAAACLPFVHRGGVRGLQLLALVAGLIGLSVTLGEPADAFEARRALVLAGTWCVFFIGGALLTDRGVGAFANGLLLLSLAWSGTALALDAAGAGHLAGVLGDTGSLSQAALPGAAVAAWFVVHGRGAPRVLGALTCATFVLHAARAPVLAGAVSLAVALIAGLWFTLRRRAPARSRVLLVVLIAVTVAAFLTRRIEAPAPPERAFRDVTEPAATAGTGNAGDLGGLEVRTRIWSRVPVLIVAHPLLGVGPGQFQSAFPPYRDPREIELSRHGVCSPETTEVEHAHDDYLEALAELGVVGGGLWIVFLLLALRAGLGAMAIERGPHGALGMAALAILVNSLFHAPLLFNPAVSGLAFVLFGALRARAGTTPPNAVGRMFLAAALGLGLVSAVLAWPLVAHGRALSAYVASVRHIDELRSGPSPPQAELERTLERARRAVEDALEAAPSSAQARLLAARLATGEEAEAAWLRALATRPHSVEALEALGLLHAHRGNPEVARTLWEEVWLLSPTQVRLLRNLARLELQSGDADRGRQWLDRLDATGCGDPLWRTELGLDLVLAGNWAAGAQELFGQELEVLVPEELHAEAESAEYPRRQAALRCLAHLLWGRAQIEIGAYPIAVRSYRQALAPTRLADPAGAPAARLELAAALQLAGRTDEARTVLAGLVFARRTWGALPGWVREALRSAGLHGAP